VTDHTNYIQLVFSHNMAQYIIVLSSLKTFWMFNNLASLLFIKFCFIFSEQYCRRIPEQLFWGIPLVLSSDVGYKVLFPLWTRNTLDKDWIRNNYFDSREWVTILKILAIPNSCYFHDFLLEKNQALSLRWSYISLSAV